MLPKYHSKPISLPPAGGGPSALEGVGCQISSWEGGFPPLPHSLVDTSYWGGICAAWVNFSPGTLKGPPQPLSVSLPYYKCLPQAETFWPFLFWKGTLSLSLSSQCFKWLPQAENFWPFLLWKGTLSLSFSSQQCKWLLQAEIFWPSWLLKITLSLSLISQ